MKKLKYALLLGSFVITAALSGCGDGSFTSLKESSMYYSDTQNKILLKKVDRLKSEHRDQHAAGR